MRKALIVLFALAVVGAPLNAGPDRFTGTAAARTEFDKGKALEKTNDWDQAALAYKRAWTIDPNFADAHDAYAWARHREALGDISKLGKMTLEDLRHAKNAECELFPEPDAEPCSICAH